MATKTRDPAVLAVLEDLDSFLEEEESNYADAECLDSEPALDLGNCCAECQRAGTPLAAAVSSGHRECLQEILSAQRGLDLHSIKVDKAATLAHLAARKGELDCLRLLLEADRSLSEVRDSKGATPLHVCAYRGHVECLRCLLSVGRCGLLRDQDGATAVHFAAVAGRTECLKVLIEEGGGDPNEQTNSGETPGE